MVIEAQCGDMGDGNWQNFAVVFSYEGADGVYAAGVRNKQWRFFQLTSKTAAMGGRWGEHYCWLANPNTFGSR